MNNNKGFIRENLAVGFMLFALFLGAGNIIFPPILGQQAGESFLISIIGFLITGVGLPLVAIVAVAKNGGDLQILANRVHPKFGIIFTSIVYLSIGPFFAIPRTGAVSYNIGVTSFLTPAQQESWVPLFITTLIFFSLTLYLAFNPTKLVDRIGKILTPALLAVILLLALKAFITPMGEFGEAQGKYIENAFSESFIQGYLTMDVLGALVFGIVIVQALQARGIQSSARQVKVSIFAGIVAAIGLSFVYVSLAYIGGTSPSAIGYFDDGGHIIAASAKVLYGNAGSIILSATIILACLTTSVGLLSANASFFSRLFPKFSYQTLLIIFTLFSLAIANVGLAKLISISLPVLLTIYPIAIVLMVIALFSARFNHAPIIYILPLIVTAFVSLYDGLKQAGLEVTAYKNVLAYLPLQEQSLGWLIPAIIATTIGIFFHLISKK
ncbi:branched-chain amino acid transport system II carrier protein [Lysinibacillus sp. 54212]|uniref:branched-chain amino acid transport system II carrier protein n=1 Tax=Lysinibacillus sp. 54212 TaxID=3119829 RepID=UPI002FC99900